MKANNSLTAAAKQPKLTFSQSVQGDAIQKMIRASVANPEDAKKLTGDLISMVAATPKLQECNAASVVAAALRGAGMGLSLGREYNVVPYGDNAGFVIGYKGLLALLLATGEVADTDCIPVYEGELVGRDPRTKRRKFDFSVYETEEEEQRHPIIGYYFYVEMLSGYFRAEYMSIDELLHHADRYVSYFSYALYNKWRRGEKLDQNEQRTIGLSYEAYQRIRATGEGTRDELRAMQALGPWYCEGGAQIAMMKKTVIRNLLNSGYVRLANSANIKAALAADPDRGVIPDLDLGLGVPAMPLAVDESTGEVIEPTAEEAAPTQSAPPAEAQDAKPAKGKAKKPVDVSAAEDADYLDSFFGE